MLQDAVNASSTASPRSRGNYPGNFLHYSRVNETIVSVTWDGASATSRLLTPAEIFLAERRDDSPIKSS